MDTCAISKLLLGQVLGAADTSNVRSKMLADVHARKGPSEPFTRHIP